MSVYSYSDYRQFLKDAFCELQRKNKHLSIREILRRIGSASPSYYKEVVIDSKKNMSQAMARKVAAFLKLDKNEADYFLALVGYNQSKTELERAVSYERLIRCVRRESVENRFLSVNEYKYLSSWEIPALREALRFHARFGNRDDADRKLLADRFLPKVTDEQVRKAITLLESLKFIEKDSAGNYRKTNHNIRCVEKTPAAYTILCQNMKHAQEIINTIAPETRIFKALILSVSAQEYALIEKKVNEFSKEILDIASNQGSVKDRLYSLGVQLFPLTKMPKEKRP